MYFIKQYSLAVLPVRKNENIKNVKIPKNMHRSEKNQKKQEYNKNQQNRNGLKYLILSDREYISSSINSNFFKFNSFTPPRVTYISPLKRDCNDVASSGVTNTPHICTAATIDSEVNSIALTDYDIRRCRTRNKISGSGGCKTGNMISSRRRLVSVVQDGRTIYVVQQSSVSVVP